MDLCRKLVEMEAAPNQRNAVTSLTDDLLLNILHHLSACSLCSYKCVYRSWKCLISNNHQVLPQTMADFFYDTKNGKRNFTSVTGERPPNLSFLPFLKDNVVASDWCNSLILCWCLRVARYRYVICNPMS
jgi:hypothetical protein